MADDPRIQALEARNADALALAELASLPPRVTPALLRVLRHRFLPRVGPAAELDLWFSGLVQARSGTAIAFEPGLQQALRGRLALRADRDAVRVLTERAHAQAHPMARAEVALAAAAAFGSPLAALEQALEPLLADLRAGGTPALDTARWLLQAAPRWHPRIFETPLAWATLAAASARLGHRRLVQVPVPAGVDGARVAALWSAPPAATVDIGVRLEGGALHFVAPDAPEAAVVQAPAHWPALVSLRPEGGSTRVVSAVVGNILPLPEGVSRLQLRLADGRGWLVESQAAPVAADIDPLLHAELRVAIGRKWYAQIEIRFEGGSPGRAVPAELRDFDTRLDAAQVLAWARKDPWQVFWPRIDDPLFWQGLASLRTAASIGLWADSAALDWWPWETLVLPEQGTGDPLAPRAVGQRMLRTRPRRGPAPKRSPPQASLQVVLVRAAEADLLPVALAWRGREGVAVTEVDDTPGDRLRETLRRLRPQVVHWSSAANAEWPSVERGAGRGEPGAGLAIDGGREFLPAHELAPPKRPPDLLVLDYPLSGRQWARAELVSGLPRSEPVLIDRIEESDVPVIVACGGWTRLESAGRFLPALYHHLLDGQRLIDAVMAARREAEARDDGQGPDLWQVWGDAHWRLPLPVAPPDPLAASIMKVSDLGETVGSALAFFVGPGVIVSAGAGLRNLPFVVDVLLDDGRQYALGAAHGGWSPSDRLDGSARDLRVWAAVRVEDGRAPPPHAPLALAQEPIRDDESLQVMHVREGRLLRLDAGRPQSPVPSSPDEPAWLRLDPFHDQDVLGSPVLRGDEVVGVVADQDGPLLHVQLVPAIRAAVQRLRDVYIRRRLDEHAEWLRTLGRGGRRFEAPRADLAGADLGDADLRDADLRGADLTKVRWTGTRIDGAELDGARMDDSAERAGALPLRTNGLPRLLAWWLPEDPFAGATIAALIDMPLHGRKAQWINRYRSEHLPAELESLGGLSVDAILVLWTPMAARLDGAARQLDLLAASGVPFAVLHPTGLRLPPDVQAKRSDMAAAWEGWPGFDDAPPDGPRAPPTLGVGDAKAPPTALPDARTVAALSRRIDDLLLRARLRRAI